MTAQETLRRAAFMIRADAGFENMSKLERELANWLEYMAGLLDSDRYQKQSPPGNKYAIAVAQAVIEEYEAEL
jgi:hypothetical protein